MALLFKQNLCRFLPASPAVPNICHTQREGKAGSPFWRAFQRYESGWIQQLCLWLSSTSDSHFAPVLLGPSDVGCGCSAIQGCAGQLHWIIGIPTCKRGYRTTRNIKELLLQGASLENRDSMDKQSSVYDTTYHAIQNSLIKLISTASLAECDYHQNLFFPVYWSSSQLLQTTQTTQNHHHNHQRRTQQQL